MLGRLFRKPKKRSAEDLGLLLAELAMMPAERQEDQAEAGGPKPDPLGAALVSMSAVIWGAAHHAFVAKLPSDRFAAMRDAYYENVWERITARFGKERTRYDEFAHRLGGLLLPDSMKTDWSRRTGVHDVLSVALGQITPAADQFLAARDDERAGKAIALGAAVGKVLFLREVDRVEAEISILAYLRFKASTDALMLILKELEKDGIQIV